MRRHYRQLDAFNIYVALGPGRSLRRLHEALLAEDWSVSLRTLETWSATFGWQARLDRIESSAFGRSVKSHTESYSELADKLVSIGLLLQQRGIDRLLGLEDEEITPMIALRMIAKGLELEIDGGNKSGENDDEKPTGDERIEELSDDELRRLIEGTNERLRDIDEEK